MLRILLIPDKFKGSLTAEEAVEAMQKGIQKAVSDCELHTVLASDGGDGFLHAISKHVACEAITIATVDPLGRACEATYLFDHSSRRAYIELAKASGLELLTTDERNVMNTSTYGTGLLVKHAVEKGALAVYLGLGGSATNDGGIGIANALGYEFLNECGEPLQPIGGNLTHIKSIQKKADVTNLEQVSFFAINDVDNPLFGKQGAAYIYGKQKGATAVEIATLDKGLMQLSKIVKKHYAKDMAAIPGAGAAGGTAYGLKVFFDAEFVSGVDFVLKLTKVDNLVARKKFDYIITGEGKFDNQTLHGKLIKGVLALGKRHQIPVIAVCGQLEIDKQTLKTLDLDAVIAIKDPLKSLAYNMSNASHLLEQHLTTFFQNRY